MRKRFCCLIIAVLIMFGNISVYAADSNLIFTDYTVYTARVFVYDTSNDQVVLVNVAPIKNPYSLNQAPHIEYKALPVYPDLIFGSKGQRLTPETINGFLLDSTVTVVVGKNGYGYKIVFMQFK